MEDEEKQEGDTGMVLSGSITWPALCFMGYSRAPYREGCSSYLTGEEAELWDHVWLARF